MSYQSDMKAYSAEWNRRRKITFLAVKITSAVLAVMLILTSVLVAFELLGDSGDNDRSGAKKESLITATQGKTVTVYVGDTVAYRSYVEYPAGYELEYTSDADLSIPGNYTVTYKLLKDGKVVETYKLTLVVAERNVELEELMTLIGKKAAELGITKEMSKVEQVKKIYAFVNGNIPYTTTSQSHTGTDRSKWETNWVAEAKMTLQSMTGDCYSNYSLSKAFFEYFGIENVGIMRDENDDGLDGTHFWNIVNVGSATEPQWYYYDSTRLSSNGSFSHGRDASLLTLDQLWSYSSQAIPAGTASTSFYAFNPNNYPTVATTPIT